MQSDGIKYTWLVEQTETKVRVQWPMLTEPAPGRQSKEDCHVSHTESQPSLPYSVRPGLKPHRHRNYPLTHIKTKASGTENLSLPSTLSQVWLILNYGEETDAHKWNEFSRAQ